MIINYDFGEEKWDYECEDLEYALASIIADNINEEREKKGNSEKIKARDVFDAYEVHDLFECIDESDYAEELYDYYYDMAHDEWREERGY